MRKTATVVIILVSIGIYSMGCDQIMGGGQTEAPQAVPAAVPPAQTAPLTAAPQAVAVPGQPVATPVAVPGQAAPVAAVPGQPAAVATPAPVAAPTPPTPTGDALTDKLSTKKYETAPDFTATSALLKQELQKNKTQSYQVQLPGPPYCHTYIAVADDSVDNIDLTVESPTGTREAADDQQASAAVVANHCPTVPGAYKLTAAIPKGKGEFAIQVFSK